MIGIFVASNANLLQPWGMVMYQRRRPWLLRAMRSFPEVCHIPHGLIVAKLIPFIEPHAQVPLQGPGNDHGRYKEHVIDDVEGLDRAPASVFHHRCPELSTERSAVSQRSYKAGPVDQGLQLRSYIGEVG